MKMLARILKKTQEKKDLTNQDVAKFLKITSAHYASIKYGSTTHISERVKDRLLVLVGAKKREVSGLCDLNNKKARAYLREYSAKRRNMLKKQASKKKRSA